MRCGDSGSAVGAAGAGGGVHRTASVNRAPPPSAPGGDGVSPHAAAAVLGATAPQHASAIPEETAAGTLAGAGPVSEARTDAAAPLSKPPATAGSCSPAVAEPAAAGGAGFGAGQGVGLSTREAGAGAAPALAVLRGGQPPRPPGRKRPGRLRRAWDKFVRAATCSSDIRTSGRGGAGGVVMG